MAFFNTQSKKRPLLRLPALATHREVQVSREVGCRERPAFVHPAQHGFCFASLFKHVACLNNGDTSLYRDGQEAQVPCPREVVMPREAGTPGAAVAQGGARAATAG